MKALLFTILLLVSSKFLFGIDPDSLKIKNDDVKIFARRLTSPIHIDGKLIEPFWRKAGAVKSLNFSKVEILLRRSPLDISYMLANNQVAPFRMTIQNCTTQT